MSRGLDDVQRKPRSLALFHTQSAPTFSGPRGKGSNRRPRRGQTVKDQGAPFHPLGNGEPLKEWEGHAPRGNFDRSRGQL